MKRVVIQVVKQVAKQTVKRTVIDYLPQNIRACMVLFSRGNRTSFSQQGSFHDNFLTLIFVLAMYPTYAKWIKSHRDLPIKLNQWNNVVVSERRFFK